MLLEFIGNLSEKFRNIACEIQELSSKTPGTFLKNSEEKQKSSRSQEGFDPSSLRFDVEHSNHYVMLNLF